ncbi:MAG: hypothetical protein FJX76_18265 [Armatimonadetes bacterium]|nr:hypothetical protein [Armatimonadota bacterium]
MWAIYRKEMRAFLLSPMAWIFWCVFLILFGLAFNTLFERYNDMLMSNPDVNLTETVAGGALGGFFKFLLLLMTPLLGMRLFAEEKEKGTLELLFTYPLTEWQLIFGKILSALTVTGILLALTLPQFIYLGNYTTLEWPIIWTTYLGWMLLLVALLSLGIWTSAVTNSQFVAAVLSLALMLLMWLSQVFQPLFARLTFDVQVPWFWKPFVWLGALFTWAYKELAVTEHFESFGRGVINTNDVLYYLSFAAFFLFLTYKKLESRKWRG